MNMMSPEFHRDSHRVRVFSLTGVMRYLELCRISTVETVIGSDGRRVTFVPKRVRDGVAFDAGFGVFRLGI